MNPDYFRSVAPNSISNQLRSLLVFNRGGNPKPVVSYSHFNEPIDYSGNALHGNSRRWGDIDLAKQLQVISTIVEQARARGFSDEETAFALAVARNESGFNPDAAAGTTSASGLGQLINKTGRTYGLGADNRFSVVDNARAMIEQLQSDLGVAKRKFQDSTNIFTYAYARYHDGPSLKYGGMQIATDKVLPLVSKFQDWLGLGNAEQAQ